MRFRSLDFMVVGYCACLPRSIFGSQLGIILFHSYLQLIHPQISPDYWAEYGRMLFTAGLCKPWPVEHQRPIAISLPIQPCLTARLEHHEAKRMNPRRRLMLPDQKLQQKKNKPKVALANGRKRKLFLPPPTSKYICIIWATRSMRQLKTAEESLCQNWWLDIPVYQWSFSHGSFVTNWGIFRMHMEERAKEAFQKRNKGGDATWCENEWALCSSAFLLLQDAWKEAWFIHVLAPSITFSPSFLVYLFYPLQDHRPTEKQKQPLSRLEGTSVVLGGEDEDPVQRPGHHLRGAQLAISLALGMRSDPSDQYEVIDFYRTIWIIYYMLFSFYCI